MVRFKIFKRCCDNQLYAKLSICEFMLKEISFLGHVLSKGTVAMDPAKIEAVRNWKKPQSPSDVRSFIGLAGYYHKFVKDFASIAAPLYELMNETPSTFVWTETHQAAFDTLIKAVTSAPVLRTADFSRPFVVYCDASLAAVGGVLTQEFEDGEHPIAYLSHKLNDTEKNYPVHALELMAIVMCLDKWRCYLEGSMFQVRTDHASLALIMDQKQNSRRMNRWITKLKDFGLNFKIEYLPGEQNVVADALSRLQLNAVTGSTWPESLVQFKDPSIRKTLSKDIINLFEKFGDKLKLENDEIFYKNDHNNWVPYIPLMHRADLTYQKHKNLCHIGAGKVSDMMERQCWWPTMKTDIHNWIGKCLICRREHSTPNFNKTIYPQTVISLFYRWNIDFIGPLEESTSKNKWIIVAVESLSKWVVAKALPNALSETVVEFLLNDIVRCFGVPQEIVSDQGKNFMSECVRRFNAALGIKHNRTTAYHPQSNGAVERVNKSIVSLIRKSIMCTGGNWEDHLARAVFTCRVVKHSATGFSPFFLLFGQEALTPGENYLQNIQATKLNATRLAHIRREAIDNIKKSQQYNKMYRESRSRSSEVNINVGDIVLLKSIQRGKFDPKWTLPHRVVADVGKGLFRLEDFHGKIMQSLVNRDRLAKVDLNEDFWS